MMNAERGSKDELLSLPRSAFRVSLDASSARLLASNSGLFTEGQAGFCCLTPRVVRAATARSKERPRGSRFSNRTTPALKEFSFC